MLFHSPLFLFAFLPLSVAGFFLLRRFATNNAALAWLVVTSLFFYGWWNPAYLWLIGISILVNFQLGKLLEREGARRKALLICGIALNVAALAYFKYANFFVDSVAALTGRDSTLGTIILPLGISFFTFEQIAWLVESYKKEVTHIDWLRYCVFITNFPKLIAGPIIRPHELLPQLESERASGSTVENLSVGITIFSIGFFKKVVLADAMVGLVGPVFHAAEMGQNIVFIEAWGAAIAYMFQIYFDFSGYTDMAIGVARMFGMTLPLNFNAPYRSMSMIDFWRRWHMSLSRLIRDYVYIPLGGNRRGPVRRHINLLFTMTLCGLWHGAGWTFVLWGALHGVFMVINTLWRNLRSARGWGTTSTWWSRGLAWGTTMLAVLVGWVLFRAESIESAARLLRSMAGLDGIVITHLERVLVLSPGIWVAGTKWIAALAIITLLLPTTQRFMRAWRPAYDYTEETQKSLGLQSLGWQPTVGYGCVIAGLAIAAMVCLLLTRQTEFLYFQF